jgi:hydrogenase maturation factor
MCLAVPGKLLSVRYVDEYRDPQIAHAWRAK